MLPRGIRNNNPGNIRLSSDKWQGLKRHQEDPAFFQFEAPEWGIRAVARVLITYQDKRRAGDGSRIDTVREIIERWAPRSENNTDAYVRHVRKVMGFDPSDTVPLPDVHQYEVMRSLVCAIIKHENAGYAYPDAVLDEGLRLAGVRAQPKPLTASRTVKGGQASSVGVLGSVAAEAAEQFEPLAGYSEVLKYVFLGLTVLGIGIMLYARWDDHRKLKR